MFIKDKLIFELSKKINQWFKANRLFLSAAPPDFTGQMRLNGGLEGQPVVKKRRGRRKNVEGVDLLFMNKRVPAVPDQVIVCFCLFLDDSRGQCK